MRLLLFLIICNFLLLFGCKDNPEGASSGSLITRSSLSTREFQFNRTLEFNRDTINVTFNDSIIDVNIIIDFNLSMPIINSYSSTVRELDTSKLIKANIEFQPNQTKIHWSATNNMSRSGWAIERKEVHSNYSSIGFVQSVNSVTDTGDFSFTDNSLLGAQTTYRIKQINSDGQFSYPFRIIIEGDGSDTSSFKAFVTAPNGVQIVNTSITPDSGYLSSVEVKYGDIVFFRNQNMHFGKIEISRSQLNEPKINYLKNRIFTLSYNLWFIAKLQSDGSRSLN